jgi:hypothetical protein
MCVPRQTANIGLSGAKAMPLPGFKSEPYDAMKRPVRLKPLRMRPDAPGGLLKYASYHGIISILSQFVKSVPTLLSSCFQTFFLKYPDLFSKQNCFLYIPLHLRVKRKKKSGAPTGSTMQAPGKRGKKDGRRDFS